jgi:hypothetical protein
MNKSPNLDILLCMTWTRPLFVLYDCQQPVPEVHLRLER